MVADRAEKETGCGLRIDGFLEVRSRAFGNVYWVNVGHVDLLGVKYKYKTLILLALPRGIEPLFSP